jgi:hypothetical protein
MATVTPTFNNSVTGVPRVIWEALATGDTVEAFTMLQQYGLAASVQISGTFGGATVSLEHSNDGVTWFTAEDLFENTVSATANAIYEVSLSSVYFRAAITGGAGDDVDVILVLRGNNGL